MITYVNQKNLIEALNEVDCTKDSFHHFIRKSKVILLKLSNVDFREATILKQTFLSTGGDVAVNKGVLDHSKQNSTVLLMGTKKTYSVALESLEKQCIFNLPHICESLGIFLKKLIEKESNPTPLFMGILNVTPDSFSDGGTLLSVSDILYKTEKMIKDGANIIDIGGESTRPGALPVPLKKELARVLPAIKEIKKHFPSIRISIDTQKPLVAKTCIEEGASIVNCVKVIPEMLDVVSLSKTTEIIAMHMNGTPLTMQGKTNYASIISEIHSYFKNILVQAHSRKIQNNRIILDPGIGFAKTPEQNLKIFKELSSFFDLNCKILIGHSRKSFFQHMLGIDLEDRDIPTSALSVFLWKQGVDILRVHNVKATRLAILTSQLMYK
ncbi:MAG: dihydropteroate synthase [Caldisericia bacterium]|nr:dihydropteroate synthase [Caldisericia bacterium]